MEAGGRLSPAAKKKFIDDVVAECKMSEVARKAAASRAIGMHKQAYIMATFIQEVRNEEQFMADLGLLHAIMANKAVSSVREGSDVYDAEVFHW